MIHIDRSSLGSTLDSVAESLFFQRSVSKPQRVAAARWFATRQGMPGAYAGMFAPDADDARGIRLFTGEWVRTRAGVAHLIGEECCRILSVLAVDDATVQSALLRAVEGMSQRLDESERRGYSTGIYCCGTCSAGYWRNLARHLFPRSEERLGLGLAGLKDLRRDDGTWHRFPFYYTSLALTEIGSVPAGKEMRHAAPRWEKLLPRLAGRDDPISCRRAEVGRRLLALCNGAS